MTQFLIPVIEYQSPPLASTFVGPPAPPPRGSRKASYLLKPKPGSVICLPPAPFRMNERQLAIGMVRSILTTSAGRASRKYTAAIVWPTLRFFLDWGRAPDLVVSSGFLNGFRDFSVNLRVGEIAQGISYAYWKWERGYAWIADFGPWAAGLGPPRSFNKSPDFVMFNPRLNDLAVMEAKGTTNSCHKRRMGDALEQCHEALTHQAFNRGYGSVLVLDSANPKSKGCLHICDPDGDAEVTEELRYYVFRRSFASWFDLTGDDELADWCRLGFHEAIDSTQSVERINKESQEGSSLLRKMSAIALGFDPNLTTFEIEPRIAEALGSFRVFRERAIDIGILGSDYASHSRQNEVRFPDGTAIFERVIE